MSSAGDQPDRGDLPTEASDVRPAAVLDFGRGAADAETCGWLDLITTQPRAVMECVRPEVHHEFEGEGEVLYVQIQIPALVSNQHRVRISAGDRHNSLGKYLIKADPSKKKVDSDEKVARLIALKLNGIRQALRG